MREFEPPNHEDNPLKTDSAHTVLFAEPIFRRPKDSAKTNPNIFIVPAGSEHLAYAFKDSRRLEMEEVLLLEEYAYIADALKRNDVPFRIIIAHRNLIDERIVMALMSQFKVRGLSLDPSISSTSFPRDMLVDIDNTHYLNPDANLTFPDGRGVISPLGEGGVVLRANDKLFIADTKLYPGSKKTAYMKSIKGISKKYKVGILPHPVGTRVDVESGQTEQFFSNHPDRVAAAILGNDNKAYLLVDKDYFDQKKAPWGSYSKTIKEACTKTDTQLVVIDRESDDTPYSLNFEQFLDGSIVMTSGHPSLEIVVAQIVGDQKVTTTHKPIVAYPILRHGGIRCMILIAPKKIVGNPVVPTNA